MKYDAMKHGKAAIHCATQEESDRFCLGMGRLGLRRSDGMGWDRCAGNAPMFGEETCYLPGEGRICRRSTCMELGIEIIGSGSLEY